MKRLVDSATYLLVISVNCMSISLLHCAQIAVKDSMLDFYDLDFAWKVGHACTFHLVIGDDRNGLHLAIGDDRNGLTLPQAHLPVADSSPPFSILFSHAHHGNFAQLFWMNRRQVEGSYCLYQLASQKKLWKAVMYLNMYLDFSVCMHGYV